MQATEGRTGRVFVLRLESGDVLPDCIEAFAEERGISLAQVTLIGGIGLGEVVVGPRETSAARPEPMTASIDEAHEAVALGLIAEGSDGRPALHIHAALGRGGRTVTGCLRKGVETWLVGEAVVVEITGATARRLESAEHAGLALLEIAGLL